MQGGGGGGCSSGHMSTVSKEDNLVVSSEDSSCPDDTELELALGLSLGSSVTKGHQGGSRAQQYARILTAKDFPSILQSSSPKSSCSSATCSSSSLTRLNVPTGTKRTADSMAATTPGQVVGWPPIRTYRMNSMVNQAKSPPTEELNLKTEKIITNDGTVENGTNNNAQVRNSMFVKVNMDGIPIGRKVDLTAHGGYESLAQILEDMFIRPPADVDATRSRTQDHSTVIRPQPSKLLDESFEFVLTYEDREGDWMLVGDVPWGMFLTSVKRLKIMRRTEATGIAPALQVRNGRQRSKPV